MDYIEAYRKKGVIKGWLGTLLLVPLNIGLAYLLFGVMVPLVWENVFLARNFIGLLFSAIPMLLVGMILIILSRFGVEYLVSLVSMLTGKDKFWKSVDFFCYKQHSSRQEVIKWANNLFNDKNRVVFEGKHGIFTNELLLVGGEPPELISTNEIAWVHMMHQTVRYKGSNLVYWYLYVYMYNDDKDCKMVCMDSEKEALVAIESIMEILPHTVFGYSDELKKQWKLGSENFRAYNLKFSN